MNIEQARFNMIEQQIRPWNVLDLDVLNLLIICKRENFFPESQKSLAFFDTELPLADGTFALSPKLEARILQELFVKKQESVLVIGTGTGYLPALLAHQAHHVTTTETNPALAETAKHNLRENDVPNVTVIVGNGLIANNNTYDVIVVSGSLEIVPPHLQQQLNVGGRLFVIAGQAPAMSAQLILRESATEFKTTTLFETVVPALPQSVPASKFKF
ncbi:protein-L-isoaspartate O-methyltransferase [Undibacterium sp. RTI2.1]|uniref:protein-L-isoaspartate O-methyltransferase family protein n=1 Tax=unclassified Undibacterium TaxID=2630295 RepID=UPI002AB4B120|nr:MULTISPECIES: protein-L-isoaspartate O-methyltransferase [unclassified Undibacterium]MDY7540371.1 protein-L-isoaspartate O-methyltransferase [Undibacterium sp. 5I1]MEB0029979.1 protein-L-isoaspartate O-methyltransferase [Undibacterium sp. RTI2.1]MEB0117057.1 protein-L-isoaspartate O-methyltransferase [Undibacterium sp. RTI2.2]MEB0230003.1 protein-L-isoaspartate O-methyltransferase [Undibacterium sp. 10I3]MEB0258023.1 protein-L-isoaspartate O-methyltransferase [Undibacterium sp. 5I1]